MILFKKAIFWILLLPSVGMCQEIKPNFFIRTPQVVNYNIQGNEITYTSIMSLGIGFSHRRKFIEVASLITDQSVWGTYTFFGSTLASRQLGGNFVLHTNWFGEITYLGGSKLIDSPLIFTSGVCFFLNYAFEWGALGIPLCAGIALQNNTISFNTRTIFNLFINL
ncbi:MAG: hypothetical protein AAFO69_09100 [Bacteroidota bacterium]